jgi:3-phosphoshikimate 1-carboxyvinyltransferase
LATLGIPIRWEKEAATVEGKGLRGFQPPVRPLDMGNSGTTTRLLMGLLAGHPFSTTLTGDDSLSQRPMGRVTEPLGRMGAKISGPQGVDRLPLTIQGGLLQGIRYALPVPSAQVKSALLLAGLYAEGPTTVVETIPTRDHTERMLKLFGARICVYENEVTVEPGAQLGAQNLTIPGDFSSAAFFLVAAAILPGSAITAQGIGLNPTRTGLLDLLKEMRADVVIARARNDAEEIWEPVGDVTVTYAPVRGVTVRPDRVPGMIDELPILMVAATQAQGQTRIEGAGELRVKETDRVYSMAEGLSSMGARIRAEGQTILIDGPSPLNGAVVNSFGDHRTAMSLAIAGLLAQGSTTVQGSEWIDISFPEFARSLESVRG